MGPTELGGGGAGGRGGVEGSPYNGERSFCQRWFVDDVLCMFRVCGKGMVSLNRGSCSLKSKHCVAAVALPR